MAYTPPPRRPLSQGTPRQSDQGPNTVSPLTADDLTPGKQLSLRWDAGRYEMRVSVVHSTRNVVLLEKL